MPMSQYVRALRAKVGHDLLLLQSVTVIVFDRDGNLLLARDADSGLWMTIGGAIDPDEVPADAAVRECWEETGLLVEPTRLLGVFGGPQFRITYPNGDAVSYIATMFEAKRISGELRPDGLEAGAVRFVTPDEATALPMGAWTREMVRRAFESRASPYFSRASWTPGGAKETGTKGTGT
jgi:8-oxo-dGTP pyrophosphatase MutT (NUDIX family)